MIGIADVIGIGVRLKGIFTHLTEDTRIKDEFRERKTVSGTFSLNDYHLEFTVTDRRDSDAGEYNPLEIMEKVVSVLENITTDPRKQQAFLELGGVGGRFSSNGYYVEFRAEDRKKAISVRPELVNTTETEVQNG